MGKVFLNIKNEFEISIVIRTYNEEKFLPISLEKIYGQDISKPIEIIVVDSGSTDSTLEVVKNYQQKYGNVKIISIAKETFTFGRALNIGISISEGKYIVLLSAHCIPCTKSWLKELIDPFKDIEVIATNGKQIPIKGVNPFEERRLLRLFKDRKDLIAKRYSHANGALRKSILHLCPIDENAKSHEDKIWLTSVVKKNVGKIIYVPSAAVYHSHSLNLMETYSRAFWQEKIEKKMKESSFHFKKISIFFVLFLCVAFFAKLFSDYFYFILNRYFVYIFIIPIYVFVEITGILNGYFSSADKPLKAPKWLMILNQFINLFLSKVIRLGKDYSARIAAKL